MKFFLGTHISAWLSRAEVPLFVSRRTMPKKRFKRATCDWALDSGGFSELTLFGEWTVTPQDYADEVRRYQDEIGRMEWAAIQDWMCEEACIVGGPIAGRTAPGTGKSVREHQRLTTDNLHALRKIAPEVPWAPVLQGFHPEEYFQHAQDYKDSGVDLTEELIVGVGSVCRRQGTTEIADLFADLSGLGINLHGFGVKSGGLKKAAQHLASADSLAWSYCARRLKLLLPECEGLSHKNCANCYTYALQWREKLLNEIPAST
jgi:hypothetical protein